MNEYMKLSLGFFQKQVNIPLRRMIPLSARALLSDTKNAFWVQLSQVLPFMRGNKQGSVLGINTGRCLFTRSGMVRRCAKKKCRKEQKMCQKILTLEHACCSLCAQCSTHVINLCSASPWGGAAHRSRNPALLLKILVEKFFFASKMQKLCFLVFGGVSEQ